MPFSNSGPMVDRSITMANKEKASRAGFPRVYLREPSTAWTHKLLCLSPPALPLSSPK